LLLAGISGNVPRHTANVGSMDSMAGRSPA
jgi:hypothetical protein